MAYELYYWPMIQGRGEFVRLALEEAGADYVDVARAPDDETGIRTMMRFLKDDGRGRPPFAPPFLKDGAVVVGQTAAILLYLGPRLGLVPDDEAARVWTHQIQLTIADVVAEAHDTHHPVGVGLYYEDQKPEAAAARRGFPQEAHPEIPRLVRDDPRPQSSGGAPPGRRVPDLRRPVAVPARRGLALRLSQSRRSGRSPSRLESRRSTRPSPSGRASGPIWTVHDGSRSTRRVSSGITPNSTGRPALAGRPCRASRPRYLTVTETFVRAP